MGVKRITLKAGLGSGTWPLQWGPAPMPMVGMSSSEVMPAARLGGTHSSTTEKQPAACSVLSTVSRLHPRLCVQYGRCASRLDFQHV